LSVLRGDIFRRIRKSSYTVKPTAENNKLVAADSTPMPVIKEIMADIKIAGLGIPCTFCVVENLAFEAILGVDFLTAANAVVDVGNNTLSLCDGFIAVPLITATDSIAVSTIDAVSLPAYSESIFNVSANVKQRKGLYMIESSPFTCCKRLFIARTIFTPTQRVCCCRVFNPTNRTIELPAKAVVAMATPVEIVKQDENQQSVASNADISVSEMRRVLEELQVSFKDCAFEGKDLDALIRLLYRHKDRLATKLADLEVSDLLEMQIDTGDALPRRERQFRHTPIERQQIKQYAQELLDAGKVRFSDSPWAANVILVAKKDGGPNLRVALDYRFLNSVSRISSYKLPTFQEIVDNLAFLGRSKYFLTLDLRSGYWQTKLDPRDAHKTAFHVDNLGRLEWIVTPMGLSNAGAFFQRVMELALRDLIPETAICYLDDIIAVGETPQQLLRKLDLIFDRLRKAKLKVHPSKSHFGVKSVRFLGHIFSENGIAPDSSKYDVINKFPVPRNSKNVKSFLGLAGFYRRYVPNYSVLTYPLRQLTKEDTPFKWTDECQQAFLELKRRLTSAPILMLPRLDHEFIITTDASQRGTAWILSQKDQNNRERVICYGAKALSPAETRYSIAELECLALVQAVRENHTYIANNLCEVRTDNISLRYLNSMKLATNNRLTRWALFLQSYRLKLVHKPGITNQAADALSRIPWEDVERESETKHAHSDATIAPIYSPTAERTLIEFGTAERTSFACPVTSVNHADAQSSLPTASDIRTATPQCPQLGPIFNYLRTRQLPTDAQAARRIVYESENYIIEDDLLYFLYTPRTRKLDRAHVTLKLLCIPDIFRHNIAVALHDFNTHIGFQRLYATCKLRYYFKNMYQFLREHVLTCQVCQQAKRPTHPQQIPIQATPMARPLCRWLCDFHGPFPNSLDANSDPKRPNRYVIALVDQCTLWVELCAVPDVTAQTVVRTLFDNIVSRYGVPSQMVIQSDNGSAFIAKLTKLFCDTFGIHQNFSTPFHPQPNSKVENFGNSLNTAIRILTTSQSEWSQHLQTIAMSHRASATCSTGMSPYEIIYGQPMQLFIDHNLLSDKTDAPSLQAYMQEIKPKLTVLHQLAMENASDSASRHRQNRNKGAQPPSFKVGDQVLLHDPSNKTGENPKLKRRWKGIFLIAEVLNNYNFQLQELKTGKMLKRPVHGERLRPLHTLDNDYRLPTPQKLTQVFECVTQQRKLSVHIVVGDILQASTHAIGHLADTDAAQQTAQSKRLFDAAGTGVLQAFTAYAADNTPTADGRCFITPAGNLTPIRRVAHVYTSHDTTQVQAEILNCLHAVDTHHDIIASITLPFYDEHGNNTYWDIAQQCADAVKNFDISQTDQPRFLTQIDFVCQDLTAASVLQTVFTHTIPAQPTIAPQTDGTPSANEPQTPTVQATQWFEIERVIKRRRRKLGDEYLVKWKDFNQTDWVKRSDLSPAALQDFLQRQPVKTKRHARN
jgi:transposase InsO family protein